MSTTAQELASLMEQARQLPPPTAQEKSEQALNFAYGNLAASTNHKPSLAAFWATAQGLGWSHEQFARWAAGRQWWER